MSNVAKLQASMCITAGLLLLASVVLFLAKPVADPNDFAPFLALIAGVTGLISSAIGFASTADNPKE